MSKLEDTLRKDGWTLTPCNKLKPGDYIAVITVGGYIDEGLISRTIERDSGYISVFYGDYGFEVFRTRSDDVWVAPKEYEHLEVRWGENGNKFINISTDPRKPLFCLASLIEIGLISAPNNQVEIMDSCRSPEILLKEKPE